MPDGADAALITSDVNRRYFTGMKSSAGIVVILRDEAYLIIDFRYIEKAEKTVKNCTVIKQSDNLSKQLSDIFKEHGVKTVAVESMDMTVSRLNMMKKSRLRMKITIAGHHYHPATAKLLKPTEIYNIIDDIKCHGCSI